MTNAPMTTADAGGPLLAAVKKCRVEMEMLRRQYEAEGKGAEWVEHQSYLIRECDEAIAGAEKEARQGATPGKLKSHEKLTIASMGKLFDVTAIFADDDAANAYLARHPDEGVIAAPLGFAMLANIRADGRRYAATKGTLKLWLVHASDDNGESLHFFVSAETPEDALAAWRAYLVAAFEFTESEAVAIVPRIFAVPGIGDSAAVHSWQEIQL